MNNIKILLAPEYADYEMLDTGEGEKLERFGKYIFARPYEDAVWKKTLPETEWAKVAGRFLTSKEGGKAGWRFYSEIAPRFEMKFKDVKFWASPTPFRHLSFFPEQASHWEFIEQKIKDAKRPIKFLNLFGYTGVASLAALSAGAEVTHVDASKQSLALAKENEKLSNLTGLRIIPDDVLKFLEKAKNRGEKYDAIIMDPPKFGRGPKGETWKIEEHLPKLLKLVRQVLSDKPLFVIVNSYAIDSSALSLVYALDEVTRDFDGEITAGELCLLEKSCGRKIPLSNTAIWQS